MGFGRITLVAVILGGKSLMPYEPVLSDAFGRSAAPATAAGVGEREKALGGARDPATGGSPPERVPPAGPAAAGPASDARPAVSARALRRPTLFDFLRGMVGD